jgi:exopolysaccharide biosynthesis polyprenyl glycosylphosphotransferase
VAMVEAMRTETTEPKPRPDQRVAPRWRPRNTLLRTRIFLLLVTSDAVAIVFGFVSVASLRGALIPDQTWLVMLLALLPAYLAVAFSSHAYAAINLQDPFRAIAKGAQAFAVAIGAMLLAAFYLQTSDSLPRLTIACGSGLAVGLLALGRYAAVRHMAALIGGNPFSAVLICDGVHVPVHGASTVMFAADAQIDPERHDPAMYDRLATALRAVDRVVVACTLERRRAWAHLLKGANVQSEILVPELLEFAPLALGIHAGEPTLVVGNGPLGLFDRLLKRTFDLLVAAVALLLLAPLMLAVAVAVKLGSPGPVLFRQVRIGRGNQQFEMLKFRSMKVADADGVRSTARDDDRVTPIGRVIRRTSIDELPQLLNVLAGSMSIVGPRPHALGSRAEEKLFWDIDRRYWHRHATKPGLTGLAQVRGYRGATLVEDDLRNRLQADLEYLENWSIWRDLKIVLATVRVILHRNAF